VTNWRITAPRPTYLLFRRKLGIMFHKKDKLKIPTSIYRVQWFRRVVEKIEVGIEKVNHDAVETSSKNLKVRLKPSTRSTSDTSPYSQSLAYFHGSILKVQLKFSHEMNEWIWEIVRLYKLRLISDKSCEFDIIFRMISYDDRICHARLDLFCITTSLYTCVWKLSSLAVF